MNVRRALKQHFKSIIFFDCHTALNVIAQGKKMDSGAKSGKSEEAIEDASCEKGLFWQWIACWCAFCALIYILIANSQGWTSAESKFIYYATARQPIMAAAYLKEISFRPDTEAGKAALSSAIKSNLFNNARAQEQERK
jgi:hypothetical protein